MEIRILRLFSDANFSFQLINIMEYFIRAGLRKPLITLIRLFFAKSSILSSTIMVNDDIMGNRLEGTTTRIIGLSYNIIPYRLRKAFRQCSAHIVCRPSMYEENVIVLHSMIINREETRQEEICKIRTDQFYKYGISTMIKDNRISVTFTINKLIDNPNSYLCDHIGDPIQMGIVSHIIDNPRSSRLWYQLGPVADLTEKSEVSFSIIQKETEFKKFLNH